MVVFVRVSNTLGLAGTFFDRNNKLNYCKGRLRVRANGLWTEAETRDKERLFPLPIHTKQLTVTSRERCKSVLDGFGMDGAI